MASDQATRRDGPGKWAWRCQECGHKFQSAAAADRASFSDDGCPGCGGSDIDMNLPISKERE